MYKIVILSLLLFSFGYSATVYLSPNGGQVAHPETGQMLNTIKASGQAIANLKAGDRAIFLPGKYKGPFSVNKIPFFSTSGTKDNPIVVEGWSKESVVIDPGLSPQNEDDKCFVLVNLDWTEFKNFTIKNCWPRAFSIKYSRYISISNIDAIGSNYFIYVLGTDQYTPAYGLLVENINWEQDPTGDVWFKNSWEEMHHGSLNYYNGALVGGKDVFGNVVIRNNSIKHAFNGVRFTSKKTDVGLNNVDFEIYNNVFTRIRDNAIEPENSALNWWMHHNTINNSHGWFSFTDVTGGDWYLFSNIGRLNEDYGTPGDHDSGRIFKFMSGGAQPSKPIWVFHNSWLSPTFNTESSQNFNYYNNLTISHGGLGGSIGANYKFDYNFYQPRVPGFTAGSGLDQHSLGGDAMVMNPDDSDFTPRTLGPLLDKGQVLVIPEIGFNHTYEGVKPDIGAYEGMNRFEGPAFISVSKKIKEFPRMVKLALLSEKLILNFSSPLKNGTTKLKIELQSGSIVEKNCDVKERVVTCNELVEDEVEIRNYLLPKTLLGTNGKTITSWAAAHPKFRLY